MAARPGTARAAGLSKPGECSSCHAERTADPLVAAHAAAGFTCAACHSLEPAHAAKRSIPAGASSGSGGSGLTVSETSAVNDACRDCHTRASTPEALGRRYLHWQSLRRKGLRVAARKNRCTGCHTHAGVKISVEG